MREKCLKCNNSSGDIQFTEWWYCTCPDEYNNYKVMRDNTTPPKWCEKDKQLLLTFNS